MVRAVLDTNVLVSALIRPSGPPGRIVDHLARGGFELVLSPSILDELRRSTRYPGVRKYIRLSDKELDLRMAQIDTIGDPVGGAVALHVPLRDPQDLLFVAAAVEGRADFIVTGDQDLLVLGEYQGIAVVTPRAFLDLLEASATAR